MAENVSTKNKGMGIHARRAIAYIVLILVSFFCLFWFYVMIINANATIISITTNIYFKTCISFPPKVIFI